MPERTRALSAASAHAERFLDDARRAAGRRRRGRAAIREALGGPLPEHGEDPVAVIDALAAGADPGHRRARPARATSAS